jgi:hypothetical protein
MPEALAVLFIFAVSSCVYVFAWVHARDPANHRPEEDRARLRVKRAWLEERLALAAQENWSSEMKATLIAEFESLTHEEAKAAADEEV